MISSAAAVSAVLAVTACGPEEETIGWEQYKAAATREFEGHASYVIEEDIAVSLAELRAYYDRNVAQAHEHFGTSISPSTVNRINNTDDVWPWPQQLSLTYCIDNAFADKQRVINEVNAAVTAWESVANVNFTYSSSQDATCTGNNTNVTFAIRPWTSNGACAFFPSGGGCVPRTLVINYGFYDSGMRAPITTLGALKHELGHILGLRHEHIRAPGNPCPEAGAFASLTSYDQGSVMHYPDCNGLNRDYTITALDEAGVDQLYGPIPAQPGVFFEFLGCRSGVPQLEATWWKVRGAPITSFDVDIRRGSTAAFVDLYNGTNTSRLLNGADGRSDTVRVRACNNFGCSGFVSRSVRPDCDIQPF